MSVVDLFSIATGTAGAIFFLAGTLGLLRFPDVHSRLHALTKADNLGLGLVALAVIAQMGDVFLAVKILAVWALAILAAATAAQLVARAALPRGAPPRAPAPEREEAR